MSTRLTMTVLTENAAAEDLAHEHGLSVHMHYERDGQLTQLLLDFGQTDAFARNAAVLGIDLGAEDLAVLSHAHYDHADGMPAFFARNTHAQLYLSAACGESCWSTKGGTTEAHYIGPSRGLLATYADRLTRVPTDKTTTIAPGVHLVPHTTAGLGALGQQAGMLLHEDSGWRPDDFAHEISLVIELAPATEGTAQLAVFNSCSHAGLPVIAREVGAAFPTARIAAYVGGLHLVHATDEQILQVADAVRAEDIGALFTGHCTGAHACDLLGQELPGRVHALHPGLSHTWQ